jgi:hypothetical protein
MSKKSGITKLSSASVQPHPNPSAQAALSCQEKGFQSPHLQKGEGDLGGEVEPKEYFETCYFLDSLFRILIKK